MRVTGPSFCTTANEKVYIAARAIGESTNDGSGRTMSPRTLVLMKGQIGAAANRKLSRNGVRGDQCAISAKRTSGPECIPVGTRSVVLALPATV
jgi:hypothetical protein